MGVYIRGMEMPECCCYCPFEHKNYCMAKPSLMVESAGRHPRCPLVPVPPHGRLIDADALITAHEQVCSRSMKFNLDLAPTIIPADHIGDGNEMVKPSGRDKAIQRLKDIGVLNEAGKVVEPYDKIFESAEEGE